MTQKIADIWIVATLVEKVATAVMKTLALSAYRCRAPMEGTHVLIVMISAIRVNLFSS